MIKKIKQVIRDHKAMNIIRLGGDVSLDLCVGDGAFYWDCQLFQDIETFSDDCPSKVIIQAFKNK